MERKFIVIILLAVLTTLLAGWLIYYFRSYPKSSKISPSQTEMELLEKLTAPTAREVPASKEVVQKLTAPVKGRVTPVEVLDKLTAPAK